MAFIESPRFPGGIRYGSNFGPTYKTDIVTVKSGREYRNKGWVYPKYVFNANILRDKEDLERLIAFFHIAVGKTNGFRFRDEYDHKSCGMNSTPAFDDQALGDGDGSTDTFQLRKAYTEGAYTQYRLIKKPVSGTVKVGVGPAGAEVEEDATRWAVDTTTGIVTFVANITGTVTNAVDQGGGVTRITVSSHGLQTDYTAHFSTFTGDWAGLNGLRFAVTRVDANTLDISHDSSAYAAYSSNAGEFNTLPQTGEQVVAGFEFDVPVRFDTDTLSTNYEAYQRGVADVPLIEVRV